jgi:hypothetical protein
MAITKTAKNMIQLGAGGSYSTARDAIRHQIWDTRYFSATPSDNTFFAQPIGSAWRVGSKTKNETNLTDSGKLPNGQTFLITRIGVALISAYDTLATGTATGWHNASLVAQAYTNIMQSSVFEIRIAGREYDFQVHGRQFLPSLSINGYNAGTAGSVARVGDTIVSGWIKLEPSPIFLDELVSFNVVQLVQNADTTNIQASAKPLNNAFDWLRNEAATVQVTLEGMLTRAK